MSIIFRKKYYLYSTEISENSKNIKFNFHIYLMCWIIIKNHCYCQLCKIYSTKYLQFRMLVCTCTQSNKHHIISWSSISHCIDTGLVHRVFFFGFSPYYYISSYRYSIWFYVIFYNNTHIILNLLHYRKSKIKKRHQFFFIYIYSICVWGIITNIYYCDRHIYTRKNGCAYCMLARISRFCKNLIPRALHQKRETHAQMYKKISKTRSNETHIQ